MVPLVFLIFFGVVSLSFFTVFFIFSIVGLFAYLLLMWLWNLFVTGSHCVAHVGLELMT
jgi:hypothetical protein